MSLKSRIDKLAARHMAPLIRVWKPWNPPAPGVVEVITGFPGEPGEEISEERKAMYWREFHALEAANANPAQ